MTTLSGKKGLALCILKVLRAHSSSERPLTIAQLEEYIERDFGMEVGRNAISRNLSLLREMHYPIRTGPGGKGAYLEPLFNDMELRVLIDSVLLSRYIPPQEARELIGKLTSLGQRADGGAIEYICRKNAVCMVYAYGSKNRQDPDRLAAAQLFAGLKLPFQPGGKAPAVRDIIIKLRGAH